MALFTTIKSVLTAPTVFFHSLKKEQGIKHAFWYLAIIALIGTVLGTIFLLLFPPSPEQLNLLSPFLGEEETTNLQEKLAQASTPQGIVWGGVKNYLQLVIGSFIIAAILHVWLLLFGGRASYGKTYQLLVYSGTPSYLFSWIPTIGGLMIIYRFILLAIGAQHTHGLSKARAIWMVVIPALLFILILVIAGALFLSFASQLPG